MYEIDKVKFGEFISELRKEKGITQKELASRLYISDKAVSKWETGHSVPDITLLTPLAELLGVTVTELLECRRIENADKLDVAQANDLVKKVIAFSEGESSGRPIRSKRNILIYASCAIIATIEILVTFYLQEKYGFNGFMAMVVAGIAAIYGVYFWFFMKEKLPAYYDENKVNVYVDGALHMNLTGVYFNNHNWPYIVKSFRVWSILCMTIVPAVIVILQLLFPDAGVWFQLSITLLPILGGLFIPPHILGRKYQYGEGVQTESQKRTVGKTLLTVLAIFAFVGFMSLSGMGTIRSASRVGYSESANRTRWTADYLFLDGYMQRTMRTAEGEDGFVLVIESEEGSIAVEIKDEEGNVIFSQENMETGSYEVEAVGKCVVRVMAEDHKGSFYIGN